MAINSFSLDVATEETSPKAQNSLNSSKNTNVASRRQVKNCFAEETISSPKNKYSRPKKNGHSPYLTGDALHVVSRVTEKTYMHKSKAEFSSFPMASNLYRANSAELKSLKSANRKVKKSVLTLPNDPAPQPQLCTVSDINDSDSFVNKDALALIKSKKRTPSMRFKKNRSKVRDFEFYDRDADYNLDLDCSSTDMINQYTGDGKKPKCGSHKTDDSSHVHDVWAVLRNINRFQFRPSPPMSEDSFVMPIKKRGLKRRNNRKDLRLVETCHTEQISYIADFDIESRSPKTVSQSSSFDRVTVIEKQNELCKMRTAYEKRMLKPNMSRINNRPRIQNFKMNKKSFDRAITRKSNNFQAKNKNLVKYIDNHIFGDNEFNNGFLSSEDSHDNNSRNCDKFKTNYDSPVKDVDKRKLELNEFSHSEHSGSSKAAFSNENIRSGSGKSRDRQTLQSISPTVTNPQVTGITKVVVNKGKKTFTPEGLRINSRVNTKPNNPVPKLNQTDIKRRVAKLKFPIVILGKDQLSSNYEVVKEEPVQFSGLDVKVWPFMLNWYDDETETVELQPKNNNRFSSNKNKRMTSIIGHKKGQKIISNVNKEFATGNNKSPVEFKNINRNRFEPKRITPPHELGHQIHQPMNIISMLQQPPKQKPIRQFKDKMLRLLYKKPSIQCIVGDNKEAGAQDNSKKKPNQKRLKAVDVGTDPATCLLKQAVDEISVPADKHQTIVKHSWSKARWASDFIDNVIRKIKTGVYYTYECKGSNTTPEMKEAAIQTITSMAVSTSCDSMQSISKITIKKKFDPLMVIPGFEDDNLIPKLEIETMSMNEISVKHCTTKILVHFDVGSPTEPQVNLKKSTSLIPLTVTESHTKVFKCKTTILNAMLPEELCTILPKMMTSIIKTNERLALSPVTVDKLDFYLFPIPEISRCESLETTSNSLLPITGMSSKLQTLLNGLFSNRKNLKHASITPFGYGRSLCMDLLPCLERPHFFNCNVNPVIFTCITRLKPAVSTLPSPDYLNRPLKNTCMALQPYPAYDQRIVPAYKRFNFVGILLKIFTIRDSLVNHIYNCLQLKSIPWTNIALNNITFIKFTVTKPDGLEDSFVFDATTLINANKMSNEVAERKKDFVRKYLQLTTNKNIEGNVERKNIHIQASVTVLNNKIKKKGLVKLYKKCKSSSSISGERAAVPLSKINNLEDFFSAFGTGKLLAGAFDRQGGQKILSAVTQMKNWAKELNSRQALLVILLTNKKDTPNLVRFNSVLLQGIAMNRITRANELDMEIEVIERENLCRTTQYEGISYLPASAENRDTLFEELCWIAKNTASDYHRTFDESSEKLLKSLLQKRKRLNPSYLRVMARYVGLGLLKSPVKK